MGLSQLSAKKITSDFGVACSPEKICCMNPDQFGLGLVALLNIHPECQSRSEHNSDGKVYGTCNSQFKNRFEHD